MNTHSHQTPYRLAVAALLRWWPQALADQRHVMLQGYLLLIFITVAGFCFVQGPAPYLQANLLALTAMALLYLGVPVLAVGMVIDAVIQIVTGRCTGVWCWFG